jgi:hypothetical protein
MLLTFHSSDVLMQVGMSGFITIAKHILLCLNVLNIISTKTKAYD